MCIRDRFRNVKDAGQFDFDIVKGKDGYIGYSGKFDWGSNDYPRRRSQSFVSLNDEKGSMKYEYKLKFIKN